MQKTILLTIACFLLVGCETKKETKADEPNKGEEVTEGKTDEQSTIQPVAAEAVPSEPMDGPPLPVFNLKDMSGKVVSTSTLPKDLILIFFNPGCDHCQREATAINNRKKEFNNHEVWFVSVDTPKAIEEFRTQYHLTDKNFHFASGNVEEIVNAMGEIPSVPCIYVYRSGKLQRRLDGEVAIDEILKIASGTI